ncbi:MAG: hypothetical protein O7B35_12105, partial [Deltaproteobacteria bacterium]|nr:hypothetical protein [Deltaproteobacteria bacterium]
RQIFRSFEVNSGAYLTKGSENLAKSGATVVDQSNLGQPPRSREHLWGLPGRKRDHGKAGASHVPLGGGGPGKECDVDGKNTLKIDKKKVEWKVFNGSAKVTINQITLTWPAGNGNQKKIKLGKKTIFDTETSPPLVIPDLSAMPPLDFRGPLKDREIQSGKDGKFKFEFNSNADKSGEYMIVVEFEEGCFVEFASGPGDGSFNCLDAKLIELTDSDVPVAGW